MMKRILENHRYIGEDDLPAIITEEQYKNALVAKQQRIRRNGKPLQTLEVIRKYIYCVSCRKPLKRHTKTKGKEQWYCTDDGCTIPRSLSDTSIINQTIALLNLAIGNPESINTPATEPQTTSPELTRLQNELNREMDKIDCDESKVFVDANGIITLELQNGQILK